MKLKPEWYDEWVEVTDEKQENGTYWRLKEGAPPEIQEDFKQYIS